MIMPSFLKLREIKSSCFLSFSLSSFFFSLPPPGCLSLHSKVVLKKRAEIVLESSYQHPFTNVVAEAEVRFGFFFFLLPQKRLE